MVGEGIAWQRPCPFALHIGLEETDGDLTETELVHVAARARAIGDAGRLITRLGQAIDPAAIGVAAAVVVCAACAIVWEALVLNADFTRRAGARLRGGTAFASGPAIHARIAPAHAPAACVRVAPRGASRHQYETEAQ
jgi:hypothetical protein